MLGVPLMSVGLGFDGKPDCSWVGAGGLGTILNGLESNTMLGQPTFLKDLESLIHGPFQARD